MKKSPIAISSAILIGAVGIALGSVAPAQALAWPSGGNFVIPGTSGGGAVWEVNVYGIRTGGDVNGVMADPLFYPAEVYGPDYAYCGDPNGNPTDSTVTQEINGDITVDCQPSVDAPVAGLTTKNHFRFYAESPSGYLARQWVELHNSTSSTIDMGQNPLYVGYFLNYYGWDPSTSHYTASDGTTGTLNESDGQVWGVTGDTRGNFIASGMAWGSPCQASEYTYLYNYFLPAEANVIAPGETVNIVTFVNMVFPATNDATGAAAAYNTALAQAHAEYDLGLEGRLADGLPPGLNVTGWCGPAASYPVLPDTGANTSVTGISVAISAALLAVGALALVVTRRRKTQG